MSEYFNDPNDPNGEGEFRDIPDEVVEGASAAPVANSLRAPATQPAVQVIGQEDTGQEYEEEYEKEYEGEYEEDETQQVGGVLSEEEDYSELLSDAKIRLQQGGLYQALIEHAADIFKGFDADPKAIEIVINQVIKFGKEKMEIMLGMRPEKQPVYENPVVSSPFNDLEVKLLKEIASKMSGGKTAEPSANRIASKLNSIGTPAKPQRTMTPVQQPQRQAPIPQRVQQPLPQTPAAPLKRKKKPSQSIDRLLREGMSPKDIGYKQLRKHPGQMTTDELLQRNEEAKQRQANLKTARPANAIPLPSYEQEQALHSQRVNMAGGTVALIMKALENSKKK